jgi:hypothetical protein
MVAAYVVAAIIVVGYALSLIVRLKGVGGSTQGGRQDAKTPRGA